MYQTPVDVLRTGRERLAVPSAWLHASPHQATDAHGQSCSLTSEGAVAWDVYAALVAAKSGDAALDAALGFLAVAAGLRDAVETPLPLEVFDEVLGWQDDPQRTHADILRVFDAALVLAAAAETAAA